MKCVYTIGADLISQERDGKVSVYLYDGHGSVVGLANESGVVNDTYSYDAFGNLLKSTGSTENCYRYCGEQFDESTGLYYLRARYMDTSTGRFISQDSYAGSISDPVSLHKYLYANADPVNNSDPSGYMTFVGAKVASAICGILVSMATTYLSNVFAIRDQTGEFDLALNPDWGNTAECVVEVKIPKGTIVYEGYAAPQIINGGAGYLYGGGSQEYIPEVDAIWFGQ